MADRKNDGKNKNKKVETKAKTPSPQKTTMDKKEEVTEIPKPEEKQVLESVGATNVSEEKVQQPGSSSSPTESLKSEEVETEGAAGGDSWSGWFSSTLTSTINSAKQSSSEMYEYLKKDITEFSDSVQEVGRDLKEKLKIEDTAKVAAERVGSNFNYIVEQMSTIFGVEPDDDDETSIMVGPGGRPIVNRLEAKLYSLAMNEDIFTKDPEDIERYEDWMAHFDLEQKHGEMADLLTANPHLQIQYTQLVPDKVTHLGFWHRFYYQVHLIYEAEAEAKAAKANASKTKMESSPAELDDKSGQDIVEISEEDQKRLLAEYEEEMKKCSQQQGGKGEGAVSRGSSGHSRESSGTELSSSSSFAFVTHDRDTDEVKIE